MIKLRPLDQLQFAVKPVPARDIGPQGELRWIKISQLRIDPDYQRAILDSGKANIRRMIEGFSWLLFGAIVVAKRGGGHYAIIDGQHRATAAMLHGGIETVPCLVMTGAPKDEARAFSAINGNITRIHTLQSFRAKVAAGDSAALELVAICAHAAVTIAPYPKPDLRPGETMSLGTIHAAIKHYGADALMAALTLLRVADPESGLSAPAIMGSAHTMAKHPPWTRQAATLGEKLAARGGAAKLVPQARQRKATRGGTEWANFAALIESAIMMTERAAAIPLNRLMAGR